MEPERERKVATLRKKAWTYLEAKQPDEALRCFDEAIALAPEAAAIHVDKGTAFVRLRRLEDALKCFERAIGLDGASTEALVEKGKALEGLLRRRDGALFWEHFTDTANPVRHIEAFIAENWTEHLRQHERVTLADRALEEELRAFQLGDKTPVVTHLVGARTRED